jgi:light-independent protochlorophyllide reductase subunit B
MFREDFEFSASAAPSHLPRSGGVGEARPIEAANDAGVDAKGSAPVAAVAVAVADEAAPPSAPVAPAIRVPVSAPASTPAGTPAGTAAASSPILASWASEAERELHKIPFFVRGKARRNTEKFAAERGPCAWCSSRWMAT